MKRLIFQLGGNHLIKCSMCKNRRRVKGVSIKTPKISLSSTTMATFHPNPDEENEPWIETAAIEGLHFRIWHLIFFCFSAITVLVILTCCCVKIRIPRTKQEIEADYQRKKLAKKFRQKLKMIQNQDMDAMDLKRALEIIQEDLRSENKNIDDISVHMYPESNYNNSSPEDNASHMKAEPQQPKGAGINKIRTLMKSGKLKTSSAN